MTVIMIDTEYREINGNPVSKEPACSLGLGKIFNNS
jgi:hypothetical protein